MRISGRLGLLASALCLLACNEEAVGPRPVPAAVTVISGENQRGIVGQPLDSMLAVFVTDKFGDPVPGVLVRFTAPGAGGELVPVTQTTGPGGQAQSTWTLATRAGTHTATVLTAGLDPLVFHATAVAAAPASLVPVSGDSQSALATDAADSAVVVLVRDAYGNPVTGASVSFSPLNGSGSVEPKTAMTDTAGHARAVWMLGAEPGAQVLNIRIDSLHQIRLRARAVPRRSSSGVRMPDYSASGSWGGDRVGGEEAATGQASSSPRRTRPTSTLPCWVNALGPVPLQQQPASASQEDSGACESVPVW